jgi:hypothetical protein
MHSRLLSARPPRVSTHTSAPPPQDDLSLAGYQKHLSSCAAPAPLTSAERELQQIRINEVRARDDVGWEILNLVGYNRLRIDKGFLHDCPTPR